MKSMLRHSETASMVFRYPIHTISIMRPSYPLPYSSSAPTQMCTSLISFVYFPITGSSATHLAHPSILSVTSTQTNLHYMTSSAIPLIPILNCFYSPRSFIAENRQLIFGSMHAVEHRGLPSARHSALRTGTISSCLREHSVRFTELQHRR